MAEMKGTTVGILVRIGTGEPVEVAEVEVPLHVRLRREEVTYYGSDRVETNAFIDADWDSLNNDIRTALNSVAEELPDLGPGGEVLVDE